VSTASSRDAIVAEITINAPAERVFEAIVDPRQRVAWWGVKGRFETKEMESDLRVGGAWVMRGTAMEGRPFTLRGEYLQVERPRLLEFTFTDWEEVQTVVRIELKEKAGATIVRLTHSGFANSAGREKYQGWPLLLSMLKGYAEGKAAT
jgi:uncharacterized protein YndB with AHSA1/START domain